MCPRCALRGPASPKPLLTLSLTLRRRGGCAELQVQRYASALVRHEPRSHQTANVGDFSGGLPDGLAQLPGAVGRPDVDLHAVRHGHRLAEARQGVIESDQGFLPVPVGQGIPARRDAYALQLRQGLKPGLGRQLGRLRVDSGWTSARGAPLLACVTTEARLGLFGERGASFSQSQVMRRTALADTPPACLPSSVHVRRRPSPLVPVVDSPQPRCRGWSGLGRRFYRPPTTWPRPGQMQAPSSNWARTRHDHRLGQPLEPDVIWNV